MLMYCVCLEGKSHSQSFVKEKKRIMFLFDFFLCTFLPKHAYGKGMLELFFTRTHEILMRDQNILSRVYDIIKSWTRDTKLYTRNIES